MLLSWAKDQVKPLWRLSSFVEETKVMCPFKNKVVFTDIPREWNQEADPLEKASKG